MMLVFHTAKAAEQPNAQPNEQPSDLPDAPMPVEKQQDKPLVGPANCVSSAYTTTNPEAAAGALVTDKPCSKPENPFNRFLSTSEPQPMTPLQKLQLAYRNLSDPFNLLTVAGTSAIGIAINPHTAYGPGMRGWGYNMGVSFSQEGTAQFFGTFLVSSIFHEDPHYHRMQGAKLWRRAVHVLVSTAVMQSDSGRPIFNYAEFIGSPIDAEIADLYVPDLQTNLKATGQRVAIGIATAPIGTAVAEFLPDIAKRFNIHVILVQWIINQVAPGDGPTANF
ncbi:MAG TPA: hypothetical protein VNU94_05765 [Acidobacteriaceae bacterium]|jgi:hypothetical protein|nr:hypothetical protein [Acidobacteriaceae bacterium]